MTTSIVLAGVGGQGILLASEIAARTAVAAGFDVKTNEVHGMAQRGGSVIAQIRYGGNVFSPLVPRKTAKILGSLERIEGLRCLDYLADDGTAVVSDQKIVPITSSGGGTPYPDWDAAELSKYFPQLVYLRAVEAAAALGNVKVSNIVLLGAVSLYLDLPESAWMTGIEKSVKEKWIDLNIQAFRTGRNNEQYRRIFCRSLTNG
ncbi:MAG: indolepyruvate oxidoreductase subunit beta [Planctomycetaceae bacterium]|jgi:indolepyruvate ferredoxin oxidoreductase beta subunit|nr:indolepyruvate oxidoreductase subunit beta [Planctomycetaceae bacterium]